jgi:hypothetical protein
MKPLALTPAQQRRLEKLARDAGRTPKAMIRFVLRDGFDFCEWEVRESLAAEADIKRRGTIPNAQVQRDAQRIIDAARARKTRKAA